MIICRSSKAGVSLVGICLHKKKTKNTVELKQAIFFRGREDMKKAASAQGVPVTITGWEPKPQGDRLHLLGTHDTTVLGCSSGPHVQLCLSFAGWVFVTGYSAK